MFTLSALMLTLSLVFGAPVQAPVPAPVDVVQAPVTATCEEDMPCWDCETMGNMQCAVNPLEVEAWEVIEQDGIVAPSTPDTYMLTYQGSWSPNVGKLPLGWFSVSSPTYSNLVHVFAFERVYSA